MSMAWANTCSFLCPAHMKSHILNVTRADSCGHLKVGDRVVDLSTWVEVGEILVQHNSYAARLLNV